MPEAICQAVMESHAEVLVIGAGPTGLFLAGELARHGVQPRIIDRFVTPHTQTRATGIQPGAMEVLHRAELAEKFLAQAVPVKGLRILDENLEEVFTTRPEGFHSAFQNTHSIAQWQTEKILNENLEQRGVKVERGVTAEKITPTEQGVRVECSNADGSKFAITADYLVGAGGAHGPVRGVLEQHLDGITYTRRYLVADVASKGVISGDNLVYVTISKAGMIMIVELPGERTLVVTDLPDGVEVPDAPQLEDLRAAIARHLRRPFEVDDLGWISAYRAHRRMSPKFADGRIFLAGDAAHLCSPLAGEGMNSGFLDGASLSWKLGAVLRRGGKPSLLAAYETERHEVARQVLASSEAVHDFFYMLIQRTIDGHSLKTPPTDPTRKPPAPEMLDLAISESPLLGYYGFYRATQAVRPGQRFPERTRLGGCLHHLLVYVAAEQPVIDAETEAFGKRWSNALEVVDGATVCPPEMAGVALGGAVLVRPDGYVAFQADRWSADARNALDELLLSQFCPGGELASTVA